MTMLHTRYVGQKRFSSPPTAMSMNTTAKTAPVTLEQQRAQFAWDCAKESRE